MAPSAPYSTGRQILQLHVHNNHNEHNIFGGLSCEEKEKQHLECRQRVYPAYLDPFDRKAGAIAYLQSFNVEFRRENSIRGL